MMINEQLSFFVESNNTDSIKHNTKRKYYCMVNGA